MERDAVLQLVRITKKHFNSHAHVERDIDLNLAKPKTIISTHTLTWSVTYATRSPLLS